MVGFIYGGNTGETADSVKRKREIAALLLRGAQQQKVPTTFGEAFNQGLNGLGDSILYRSLESKADKGDADIKSANDAEWGGIAGLGGTSAPAAPAVASPPVSDATIPLPAAATDIKAGLATDPVQSVMDASGSSEAPSWLKYDNTGATRSQPLNPHLTQALGFLPQMGVSMDVFSGGQPTASEGGPRTGSDRHDHGNAADVFFSKDGRRLDWANPDDQPVFQDIVRQGKAAGITGFGAGDGYMQPGSMHLGFGKPAVWGAGGRGSNAPDWLRQAYNSPASPTAPNQAAPNQIASLDPSAGMGAIPPAGTPLPGQPPAGTQIPEPAQRPDLQPMAAPQVADASQPAASQPTPAFDPQNIKPEQMMQILGAQDAQAQDPSPPPQLAPQLPAPIDVPNAPPVASVPTVQAQSGPSPYDALPVNGPIPTPRPDSAQLGPSTGPASVARVLAGNSTPQSAPAPVEASSGPASVAQAVANSGASAGPSTAALLRVMSNPNQPEGRRQIAGLLYEQQVKTQQAAAERLAKQNDPETKAELALKQAQLAEINRNATKPIVVNGKLVDPTSGKVVGDFSDPRTATVGNTVVDLNTGKPVYQGAQAPTPDQQNYKAYADYETQAGRKPLGPLEWTNAQKATTGDWEKLDDGTLYNRRTGETKAAQAAAAAGKGFRFSGNAVDAQALNGLMDSGTITAEQAQNIAAGKQITGPNGETIFIGAKGLVSQPANGGPAQAIAPPIDAAPPAQGAQEQGIDLFAGQPPLAAQLQPAQGPAPVVQQQSSVVPQGGVQLTGPKAPNKDELDAAGFADRLSSQGKIIDGLEDAGTSRVQNFESNVPLIGNSLVSSDFQRYDTARRNFINAQLRRESGAVIGPSEFEEGNKQYFPQPGDSAKVLQDKRDARAAAVTNMTRSAGPTYKPATEAVAPVTLGPDDKAKFDALPSGAQFIDPDGKLRVKP